MTHILENFIPQALADQIEELVAGPSYPWRWRPSSAYGCSPRSEFSEDFQFINMIYHGDVIDPESFRVVEQLVAAFSKQTGIQVKHIYKAKANLLPKQRLSEAGLAETVHTDIESPDANYISLVYYVCDSDGDTIVYGENGVIAKAPEKGTAICFASNLKHRATPPAEHKRRVVINMVLEIA